VDSTPPDLQNAIAAFIARVRDGKRPAVVVMKMAAEDGRDSLAVRCIIRVGFGYPHHAAICKITLGGG
jgi:hypothetical protein